METFIITGVITRTDAIRKALRLTNHRTVVRVILVAPGSYKVSLIK